MPDEDVVVTFSHLGYVKRTPLREYRSQARGGKGRRGMNTRDEDFVKDVFVARTHDKLMTFTSKGRVYLLPVYYVPEGGPAARGRPIVNLVDLDEDETVATVIPIRDFDERSLVMVSRGGMIKRTALTDYRNIRSSGIIAIGLKDGDRVLAVRLLENPEDDSVLLSTAHGKAIHFKIHKPSADGLQDAGVRQMGRVARGVTGIKLVGDDQVVGMTVIPAVLEEPEVTEELSRLIDGWALLTVTEHGFGKLTAISEYRMQGRGGIGLIDIHTRDRNGPVVGAALIEAMGQIMIVTDGGKGAGQISLTATHDLGRVCGLVLVLVLGFGLGNRLVFWLRHRHRDNFDVRGNPAGLNGVAGG